MVKFNRIYGLYICSVRNFYIMILSTSMTCACHCILACILCTVHFLYCRSLSGRVFQFCKWRWKFSTKNSLLDGWKCHLNRHLLPKLAQWAFNRHKIVRPMGLHEFYHHTDILSCINFHLEYARKYLQPHYHTGLICSRSFQNYAFNGWLALETMKSWLLVLTKTLFF